MQKTCLSLGLGSTRILAHSVQLSAARSHCWQDSSRQTDHGMPCGGWYELQVRSECEQAGSQHNQRWQREQGRQPAQPTLAA